MRLEPGPYKIFGRPFFLTYPINAKYIVVDGVKIDLKQIEEDRFNAAKDVTGEGD